MSNNYGNYKDFLDLNENLSEEELYERTKRNHSKAFKDEKSDFETFEEDKKKFENDYGFWDDLLDKHKNPLPKKKPVNKTIQRETTTTHHEPLTLKEKLIIMGFATGVYCALMIAGNMEHFTTTYREQKRIDIYEKEFKEIKRLVKDGIWDVSEQVRDLHARAKTNRFGRGLEERLRNFEVRGFLGEDEVYNIPYEYRGTKFELQIPILSDNDRISFHPFKQTLDEVIVATHPREYRNETYYARFAWAINEIENQNFHSAFIEINSLYGEVMSDNFTKYNSIRDDLRLFTYDFRIDGPMFLFSVGSEELIPVESDEYPTFVYLRPLYETLIPFSQENVESYERQSRQKKEKTLSHIKVDTPLPYEIEKQGFLKKMFRGIFSKSQRKNAQSVEESSDDDIFE